MSRALVVAAAVIGLSAGPFSRPSAAQEPVKAYLVGDPEPGRKAPVFKLPYFTAEGPGPADQPFTLEAELGRVVVLAFCRGVSDSAAALRYVNKHKRQIGVLVATTVAVAVVMSVAPVAAPASIATAVRLAVAAAGPLKVGSDMYQRTAGAPGKARATAMAAALAEPHIARMTPRLIQRAYFAATVGLRQLRSGV